MATEKMKKDTFIEGLWPDIRKDVHLHAPKTYKKALKKAFISEQASVGLNENDQAKSSRNIKGRFKSQAPLKRRGQEISECDFCGKNHDVSESRKKLSTCYRCGQEATS